MNISLRRNALLELLDRARVEGEERYEIYLVKEVFYDQALAFARGGTCQHRKQLCDLVATNGRHMFYYFCLDCGLKLSQFLSHRSITQEAKQYAVGAEVRQSIVDARYELTRLLREFYQAGWWKAYNAYLQSDRWKALREKVLYRDGFMCQLQLYGCGQAATQVHHLTYKRVTRENTDDLTSVCNSCHEQQHERRFWEEPTPEGTR